MRLTIRVQPRASRTEVVGRHGDAIRIRLAAPPVDGAANEELIRFVARWFRVPAGAVSLVRGSASRTKTIEVAGVSQAVAEALVDAT